MYSMSKQLRASGEGKQIALTALPQRRLEEVKTTLVQYSRANPFTTIVAQELSSSLSLLEEAIAAEDVDLFWRIYNKTCRRLLEYGVVIPSYVHSLYKLR
jgi:hypothetical protein